MLWHFGPSSFYKKHFLHWTVSRDSLGTVVQFGWPYGRRGLRRVIGLFYIRPLGTRELAHLHGAVAIRQICPPILSPSVSSSQDHRLRGRRSDSTNTSLFSKIKKKNYNYSAIQKNLTHPTHIKLTPMTYTFSLWFPSCSKVCQIKASVTLIYTTALLKSSQKVSIHSYNRSFHASTSCNQHYRANINTLTLMRYCFYSNSSVAEMSNATHKLSQNKLLQKHC